MPYTILDTEWATNRNTQQQQQQNPCTFRAYILMGKLDNIHRK